MKRISLRLPDDLHQKALAKIEARRAAHGRASAKYSLNDFLIEAVEMAVKRGPRERGRAKGR